MIRAGLFLYDHLSRRASLPGSRAIRLDAPPYNAGLKRYLWCQVLPTSKHPQGPRFQGGFGVYDAPEPWGPWTTVFYTDEWDVGPG